LAVVTLAVVETEVALLEDRVIAVPQREREAQALLLIRDTGDAVLTPAVGAGARLIVGEVIPRVAVLTVVFTDRTPLPFAEIRAPFAPGGAAARLLEPFLFRHASRSMAWRRLNRCS